MGAAQRPRYVGVALGEEGFGAFEQVVGGEDADRGVELGGEAGREVGVEREVDEPLGLADRERAARGDLLADLVARGDAPRRRARPR